MQSQLTLYTAVLLLISYESNGEPIQINRSLSTKDCQFDNAVAESTSKIIKAKFDFYRRFETLEQLQLELLDYVHWFNNIRLHGTLGYLSPAEFKRSHTL